MYKDDFGVKSITVFGEAYDFVNCSPDSPMVMTDGVLTDLRAICDNHDINYDVTAWGSDDYFMMVLAL